MIEYKSNIYVEPSVSYFDRGMDADKTTISAIVAALALTAAVLTSMRGSAYTLER